MGEHVQKSLGDRIQCEDGSVRSQAENVGVSHVIQKLKTWLWISGYVLQATVPPKGSGREMVVLDFQKKH